MCCARCVPGGLKETSRTDIGCTSDVEAGRTPRIPGEGSVKAPPNASKPWVQRHNVSTLAIRMTVGLPSAFVSSLLTDLAGVAIIPPFGRVDPTVAIKASAIGAPVVAPTIGAIRSADLVLRGRPSGVAADNGDPTPPPSLLLCGHPPNRVCLPSLWAP